MRRALGRPRVGGDAVLWTLFVVLLVLWLLGWVGMPAVGEYIHVLLVVAIAVALIQLLSGRRTV